MLRIVPCVLLAMASVAVADPFATSVLSSSPAGFTGAATNILGETDTLLAGFNDDGVSPWFVTVGFLPARIIDGPGDDFSIHVVDFLLAEAEQYETFASDDGVTFVSLGETFPTTTTPNVAQSFGYDLAGSGISSASAVRIVGLVFDTNTPFEGADLDSVEVLNLGLPPAIFSSDFADVDPFVGQFAEGRMNVTVLLHLDPSDPGVTQSLLDAQQVIWEAQMEADWNTNFQLANGTSLFDIVIDVVFVDDQFILDNGSGLVTEITVYPTVSATPNMRVNIIEWALDQAPRTESHELGHVFGLLDEYPGAVPPPELIDLTSLMGSLDGILYDRHYAWIEQYFVDLGLPDFVLANAPGAPPVPPPGTPISGEGAHEGRAGLTITFIPEPTTLALLALGVGVLMRRRKRAA